MSDFMRYCYVIVEKPELNTDECLLFKMIKGTSLHQTGTLNDISTLETCIRCAWTDNRFALWRM